jgi:lipopolysaccharide heptosyltransferase II
MKYLISSFTGLGNFIQKTPVVRKLYELDPYAKIDLIGDNKYGALDVLKGSPFINNIIQVPTIMTISAKIRTFHRINHEKYDAIILPFTSSPLWLRGISYISNAKKVIQHISITYASKVDRLMMLVKLLNLKRIKFIPLLSARHEIDLYFDLIQALFDRPIEREKKTFIPSNIQSDISEFGIKGDYICLQIAAANGLKTPKRWPSEYFLEFVDMIKHEFPSLSIVLVGSQKEYDQFIKPFADKCPHVENIAGKTDINQVVSIIRKAKLVICHDSGIMHMANALDVPLIAIYGPTDYSRTAPLGERSFIIKKDLPCSPCMFNLSITEKYIEETCREPQCMYSIKPNEVFEKVVHVLSVNNTHHLQPFILND